MDLSNEFYMHVYRVQQLNVAQWILFAISVVALHEIWFYGLFGAVLPVVGFAAMQSENKEFKPTRILVYKYYCIWMVMLTCAMAIVWTWIKVLEPKPVWEIVLGVHIFLAHGYALYRALFHANAMCSSL